MLSIIAGPSIKNHNSTIVGFDDDIESISPGKIQRTAHHDDQMLITVLSIALGGALVTALILFLVRYNLLMLQKALYTNLLKNKDIENGDIKGLSNHHKASYHCHSVDTLTIISTSISDDDFSNTLTSNNKL